eukprot:Hpha_TRINITY_DN9039_c0_g1::TRINITY_DN9039_c0_g1_i1::g.142044::m.142044
MAPGDKGFAPTSVSYRASGWKVDYGHKGHSLLYQGKSQAILEIIQAAEKRSFSGFSFLNGDLEGNLSVKRVRELKRRNTKKDKGVDPLPNVLTRLPTELKTSITYKGKKKDTWNWKYNQQSALRDNAAGVDGWSKVSVTASATDLENNGWVKLTCLPFLPSPNCWYTNVPQDEPPPSTVTIGSSLALPASPVCSPRFTSVSALSAEASEDAGTSFNDSMVCEKRVYSCGTEFAQLEAGVKNTMKIPFDDVGAFECLVDLQSGSKENWRVGKLIVTTAWEAGKDGPKESAWENFSLAAKITKQRGERGAKTEFGVASSGLKLPNGSDFILGARYTCKMNRHLEVSTLPKAPGLALAAQCDVTDRLKVNGTVSDFWWKGWDFKQPTASLKCTYKVEQKHTGEHKATVVGAVTWKKMGFPTFGLEVNIS